MGSAQDGLLPKELGEIFYSLSRTKRAFIRVNPSHGFGILARVQEHPHREDIFAIGLE